MTTRLTEKALREAMAELQDLVIVIWRSQDRVPHPNDLRVVITPAMNAWPSRIGEILRRGNHALKSQRCRRTLREKRCPHASDHKLPCAKKVSTE